ncbi:uncharacterized protein SPSK_06411 [Sporothrix schenckii 1099-18]|uniref:Uncharacterized protein n=2 Tax=Sporothrix schenckii TaxID=29908 RepID=U7PT94_SPOS1|nr:uncharacterized protein SPSK_06411 [Sporothrix schenckii 1099-18]ERS98166.1 hypothetical protein HMPREF1624_04947 [Sporothrix schenckii ATCC 58251]KJR89736.1 hypothetical protein SPSK_06411 [Sporothrix schenckii 1099-18]
MTSQNPTGPLEKTADSIVVDGQEFHLVTRTKAATRGPTNLGAAGPLEPVAAENRVPQDNGGPVSFVSSTNTLKRQKTGFEAVPSQPSSYVAMPMKTTGITSGPPPAPPSTPNVKQSGFAEDKRKCPVVPIEPTVIAKPSAIRESLRTHFCAPFDGSMFKTYAEMRGGAGDIDDNDNANANADGCNEKREREFVRAPSSAPQTSTDAPTDDNQELPWPKGTLWDHSVSYQTTREETEAREMGEASEKLAELERTMAKEIQAIKELKELKALTIKELEALKTPELEAPVAKKLDG